MPRESGTGVAAFRSRQQVQLFEQMLLQHGLYAHVIHTPHEIAIGCGLSVEFDVQDYDTVRRIYESSQGLHSFVGFYHCEARGTKLVCTPMYKHLLNHEE
jgi:hypothetical protein